MQASSRHHRRRDADRGITVDEERAQKRDPEMRSSKKGNQWYFTKAHAASMLRAGSYIRWA